MYENGVPESVDMDTVTDDWDESEYEFELDESSKVSVLLCLTCGKPHPLEDCLVPHVEGHPVSQEREG